MLARCPASTSNLGPGFDVLSLALSLYVEVEAEPADALSITATGAGAHFPSNPSHLAARVARDAVGHDRFSFRIDSQIPVGRGLGSSAALAVAVAAAVGADDPFAVGVAFDGHAENAAASSFGGLCAATIVDGEPISRSLVLDPQLSFVVLVPDFELATERARAVLPSTVPFADAVTNLGRMGLLLAGLSNAAQLDTAAGVDRLHQDQRAALFPEAPLLIRAMIDAGATVATWSGAGPSLLGICSSDEVARVVQEAGERALFGVGVPGRSLRLAPDLVGLVVQS